MYNRANSDYSPEDAGKVCLNSRGNLIRIRKYHITENEKKIFRKRFEKITKDVPDHVKEKAGPYFFNPYRIRGVYFAQIQALYLLGANEWHSYIDVKNKMKEFASTIEVERKRNGRKVKTNVWEVFDNKESRSDSISSKDTFGRIDENMRFFQRMRKLNPYGYKLKQVSASLDIKIIYKASFKSGLHFYRLSTYSKSEEAIPIRLIINETEENKFKINFKKINREREKI